MYGVKVTTAVSAVVLLLVQIGPTPALADTIEAALVRAYQSNPELNAQRAQVRSTDENVPQALSGYRPTINVNTSLRYQYIDTTTNTPGGSAIGNPGPPSLLTSQIHGANAPRGAGITVTQTMYNGNRTANRTRAAESQVSG